MSAFIALLLLQAAPAGSQPPCAGPEYRQLDFWVGKWDVFPTGTDRLVAHSLIERLYDGCAIRENWMPLKKEGGGSLSGYDRKSGKWHQTWIDSSGSIVRFTGGRNGAEMVMDGLWGDLVAPGQDAIVRMTYSPLPDGSVRQLGLQSVDQGKTWQPSFDFTYRRAR
jgi:hypothetical protein